MKIPSCAFLVVLSFGKPAIAQLPPPGYDLEDPNAQHDWVAKELANANRLPEAIESFKAAARFVAEHVSFANLGVAYMRNREFGLSLKALLLVTD
eukprot:symbB.v1.2.019274.t1/scaffold1509.1/size114668/9